MVMDSLRAYTALVEACCAPVAAGAGAQDHASLRRGPPLLLLEMVAARDEGLSFSSSPELLVAKILGAQLGVVIQLDTDAVQPSTLLAT